MRRLYPFALKEKIVDSDRFDVLTRFLSTAGSRRRALAALGGLVTFGALSAGAKRGKKKPKKKLALNAFGCVDVGQPCRGNSTNCCSGICQGKKPKKGKKDRSTCVAHDASTCLPGQQIVDCGAADVACTTSAGEPGACTTTTGNAPYCAESGTCFPCTRDADCQAVCGPQAACAPCAAVCAAKGGTACFGPSSSSCEF